jgi:hypothetical protein
LETFPDMASVITPILQFRSNSIIEYNSYDYYDCPGFKRNRQDEFTANLKKQETYTGRLSDGAKKRLRKSLDLLIDVSEDQYIYNTFTEQYQPFRLSFITLTISQRSTIDPNEAKKNCLEPFLQWMRRQHKCYCYIWKAEFQKRGQIHFHITCNTFIDCRDVQKKWNALQQKAGYLEDYFKEYGQFKPVGQQYNAPSTSINSVRNVDKMGSYMIKQVDKDVNIMSEMLKDTQNEQSINGKCWDCSLNLKKYNRFDTIADYKYLEDIECLVKAGTVEKIATDNCTIYQFKGVKPRIVLNEVDMFRFQSLMQTIREKEVIIEKRIKEKLPNVIQKVTFRPILTLFSTS